MRPNMTRVIALCTLIFVLTNDVSARCTYSLGWGNEGRRLNCVNAQGRWANICVKSLGGGRSGEYSHNTISLDPKLWRTRPSFLHFVFDHECAHHIRWQETPADCYAVQRGVKKRLIQWEDLKFICEWYRNTGTDGSHLGGVPRCGTMFNCFCQVADRSQCNRASIELRRAGLMYRR